MEGNQSIPENISLPPSPPFELARFKVNEESVSGLGSKPSFQFDTPERASSSESIPTLGRLNTTYSVSPRTQSPRTQSPSRANLRPSPTSMLSAPLMQRAHSSPGVDSSGRFINPTNPTPRRPASPMSQFGRRRSPLRSAMEESYPGAPSWSGLNIEPNIPEHEELDTSTTHYNLSSVSENEEYYHSLVPSLHNTLPRSRRRPTSPLHPSASAPSLHTRAVSPNLSGGNSPFLAAQKYAYDQYPTYSLGSASSMPSTPTSFRSRSPSISSLETIEDSPDAEEAARIEAEEMAKLKAEDGEAGSESRRRSSLELRGSGLRSNKERKRWSVCGAERRADFSLEPIEE